MTIAERYQNVVGVLNEVNKFNQDIHVVSELMELPDQPSVKAQVRAIYFGLGQAYYVTPKMARRPVSAGPCRGLELGGEEHDRAAGHPGLRHLATG